MSTSKKILLLAALATFAWSSAASAGWLHFSNSVFRAEEAIQKHPATLTQVIVLPEDAKRPYLCAAYHNTVGQGGKGKVVVKATIFKGSGATQKLKFAGNVRKNAFLKCKKAKNLVEGDVVSFEYKFKKMARLRTHEDGAQLADVSSAISTAGEPELGQEVPLGLVPANGVAPLGLIPSEDGGWFHSAKSVFQPDEDGQKHPKALAQTLLVPSDSRRPKICVAYSNVAEEANKGRVVTKVSIDRVDGEVETLSFAGGVRQNEYLNCKKPEKKLSPGDMVYFNYELKGMPRLKKGADGAEFADINGVVSTSGDPLFREPPPPPPPPPAPIEEEETVAVESVPPPPPTNTPAPPPPPASPPPPSGGGGGAVSFADQQAVHRLLKSDTKATQLWRPRGDNPAKWAAIGPRTVLVNGKINYATAGIGSTISAAVADYERKNKVSLGSNGALSGGEASLLQWLSDMSSSNGPTSVRRDGQGRYHGEYYRTGRGVNVSTHSTLQGALDWLKKQGL